MRFKRLSGALAAVLVLVAAQGFCETDAAKAFKKIDDELRMKSKTMSAPEFADAAERSMLEFIGKYPQSPEASQAQFALGVLNSKMGAYEKAIGHLASYLAMPGEGGPDMIAQAKYLTGASEMALERYDEAEKQFREIVNSEDGISSRIREGARTQLSRIGALRRLKIGAPAVDIEGTSFQGKKIRLSRDYKGKVVLLDFWASWCTPCRQEMPNVIRMYNELHRRGFEIIGVSLDKDREKFRDFIRDNGMDWPQLFDGKYWTSDYAKLYAVNSIPATFLIDKQGIIRHKNQRGDALRGAVQQLLDEK
jgi:peroxiredoxin